MLTACLSKTNWMRMAAEISKSELIKVSPNLLLKKKISCYQWNMFASG